MPNFGLQGLVNKWVNVNQSNVVLTEEDDISVRLRAPRASASSLKPTYPRKPRHSSTTKKNKAPYAGEDDVATVCTTSTVGTTRSAFPVAQPRLQQQPVPPSSVRSLPTGVETSGTSLRPGAYRHSSSAELYNSDDTSSVAASSLASSKRRKTKRMQSAAAPLMPPGVYYGVDYDSVGREAASVRSAPAKVEGPPPPTSLFHPLCPTVPSVVGMPPPPPMAALPEVGENITNSAMLSKKHAVVLDHRDWSNEAPSNESAKERAKKGPPPPGVFREPGPPLVVSVPLDTPRARTKPQSMALEAPVQMMHFVHSPMPDSGESEESEPEAADKKADDGGMASIEAQMEAALVLTSLPKVGCGMSDANEEKMVDSMPSDELRAQVQGDDQRASRRLLKGGKRGSSPWRRNAKNLADAALQEYRCLEQKEHEKQYVGDKAGLKRTGSGVF